MKETTTRFESGRECALRMDRADPLAGFRDEFVFPEADGGPPVIYLCGNSLGLQPRRAARYVREELEDWARLGVDGHFHARRPWLPYHRLATPGLARLCGALETEVVAMNSLTVNLHLAMAAFYRPTLARYAILIESTAFPSDRHAAASQLRLHGFDPAGGLVLWSPRPGESHLRLADLEAILDRQGERIALMLLPGVQYYNGQLLDMAALCGLARAHGVAIGLDLAHAVGNVPLELHEWAPDFAAWCSYKYLNGGPGAVAGLFIPERHAGASAPAHLHGWWGNREESRFRMEHAFEPARGIESWQLSNPPIFSLAPVVASLELFDAAGMPALAEKSRRLTGYLDFLLRRELPGRVRSITPADERGCQLSLGFDALDLDPKAVFLRLEALNVVTDWREPDVVRVAPAPLYNRYEDVYEFVQRLKAAIEGGAGPA